MKDTAGNGRLQRGMNLAEAGAAVRHGDLWVVKGSDRNYTVNLDGPDGPTCACPDWMNRLRDDKGLCKHIIAAQITDSREACRRQKTAKPKTGQRHKAEADSLRGIVSLDQLTRIATWLGA